MRVNSPTAQLWQYPLSRPSGRFNYFNNYVRALDVRYAALPVRNRDWWEWFFRNFPWAVLCLEGFFDYDPELVAAGSGLEAYRNLNCQRLVSGLGVTDVPPTFATAPDNDVISGPGSDPLTVMWSGRTEFPEGSFVASVRECSLNHAPEQGPRPSSMRFSFAAPIFYGVPFSVAAALAARPGSELMPAFAVAVSISDLGGVTFCGGRVCFLKPYV